jgi:hypothetical protein
MKKIIVAMSIATAVVLSSHAQGLVFFSSSTQNMSTNNGTVGKTAAGAGNFYYALFVSTTASSVAGNTSPIQGTNGVYAFSSAAWTLVADIDTSSTAGRFADPAANGDGSTTLPTGFAAGTSAQFVVVGWSANLGSTVSALTQALAINGTTGLLGESGVSGAISAGNGGTLPTPSLFGAAAPNIQAFTLGAFTISSTPEPGTLALAALGGASLLMFRRKNK